MFLKFNVILVCFFFIFKTKLSFLLKNNYILIYFELFENSVFHFATLIWKYNCDSDSGFRAVLME